jgi:hypothetical protein
MKPTQTLIEIDGQPVEVKARKEENHWAVIVFTPAFSIRSSKLHLKGTREAFGRAVVCSIIDPELEDDFMDLDASLQLVEAAVLMVTDNFSK